MCITHLIQVYDMQRVARKALILLTCSWLSLPRNGPDPAALAVLAIVALNNTFRVSHRSTISTSPEFIPTLPSTPINNTRVATHIAATTTNSTRTRSTTHTANALAASPSGNPIIDDATPCTLT